MFYKTLRNLSRVISVYRCLIFKVHRTWFLWFSSFFASLEAPFLKWALPLYQILPPLSTLFFHLFYLFCSLSSTPPGVAFWRYSFLIFLAPYPSCKCWGGVGVWALYMEIEVIYFIFFRIFSICMWFKQRTYILSLFALFYMFRKSFEFIFSFCTSFSFYVKS